MSLVEISTAASLLQRLGAPFDLLPVLAVLLLLFLLIVISHCWVVHPDTPENDCDAYLLNQLLSALIFR
jgi:hypothetical protein